MLVYVPEDVLELAELFDKKKTTLYLVGGYVRGGLMGLGRQDDVDFASSMQPEKVISLLKNTDFIVRYKNELTGVLEIEKNNKKYEHATFRTEEYAVAGEHMPCEVKFITDIAKDVERRDFTSNSIYYDVLTGEVVDPLGGIKDIKNKTIRAVGNPNRLFKNDAERILRMVRQACECGFDIESKTLEAAKSNVFRLKFLSKGRVQKEIRRMLVADQKYLGLGLRSSHVRAFNILNELDAFKYILPELDKLLKENPRLKNGQSVEEHISLLLQFCDKEYRLPALFSLIGAEEFTKNGVLQKGYGVECKMRAVESAKEFGLSKREQKLVGFFAAYHEKVSRDKLTLADSRQIVVEAGEDASELLQYFVAAPSSYKMSKLPLSKSQQNLKVAIGQASSRFYATEVNQLTITSKQLKEALKIEDSKTIKLLLNKLLTFGARCGKPISKTKNIWLAKRFYGNLQK